MIQKTYFISIIECFFLKILRHVFQKRLDERTQTVEDVELRVYGIERTIHSTFDLPTTWQSYFMNDG